MKQYTYSVEVLGQSAQCPNVETLVAFANETLGCDLITAHMVFNYFTRLTAHMVFNYFTRPAVASKRVFNMVKVSRTPKRSP